MKNTILLAFGGEIIALALGIILALVSISPRRAIRGAAVVYIDVMRGSPLLLQLSIGYFGVVLGLGLRQVDTYQVATVILGLNAAAYTAEIFRSGITSVPFAQLEASRSLGLSYLRSMRHVVLPQATRVAIPPLTSGFVILIKDTSLVLFLGLTVDQRELLSVGQDAYAELFNATPLMAAFVGYLVITLPLIRVVRVFERRFNSASMGIS